MNEPERGYVTAEAFGVEILVLLLRLWVILFGVFAGLWGLGVIIMFWWAAIPIALIGAWWFFNSDVAHKVSAVHSQPLTAARASMPTNVPDECGDDRAVRTPDGEFKGFNSAQGSLT